MIDRLSNLVRLSATLGCRPAASTFSTMFPFIFNPELPLAYVVRQAAYTEYWYHLQKSFSSFVIYRLGDPLFSIHRQWKTRS
jgi:hypothetical protein